MNLTAVLLLLLLSCIVCVAFLSGTVDGGHAVVTKAALCFECRRTTCSRKASQEGIGAAVMHADRQECQPCAAQTDNEACSGPQIFTYACPGLLLVSKLVMLEGTPVSKVFLGWLETDCDFGDECPLSDLGWAA